MQNPPRRRNTRLENQVETDKKQRFSLFAWVPKPVKRFWRRYNGTRVLLLVVTIFLILVTGYLYYLSKIANVSVLEQSISAQTQIYDDKGQLADSLTGQKGTPTTYSQLPEALKNAVVATEDRTFYKNNGVNVERTLLALGTLGHFGGGSTITQQIAKNAYLSQAKTVDRKAREIFLALQISKHYSKNDILTMYLNQNPYGNGIYGVQDASEKYFGVPVSQLTVDEAATIAGIPNLPAYYNPLYDHAKYATERRNIVLQNMVNAGYLSQADCDKYQKVNMLAELKDNYQAPSQTYKYPSYDNAVVAEAQKTYHLTTDQILNGGYKIYTGIDQKMQDGMQKTYAMLDLFPQMADGTYAQGASVATDPKNGEVRALVGNAATRGYNGYTDFNYATQAQRSTGSAIKPLIAYSPAIEDGWTIDKTVYDVATTYPGGWKPTDAEAGWRGAMPMYQALANSYNIPAITTYEQIGPSKGNALGRKFGITSLPSTDIPLSTVLGSGLKTNAWQMTQAYTAFANGGVMPTQHLITKIENAAGQVIASASGNETRVISSDVADKMTEMMLGTFSNGTGLMAYPKSYTLAGKTGTNESTDAWVIGYTPDLVTAEWMGFANSSNTLPGTSWNNASEVFREETSYMLPYTAGTQFTVQNAYTQHNIAPEYPGWTYLRQTQDDIVDEEQYEAHTTGNSTTSSTTTTTSSSDSSGFDPGKTAKDIWNKIVNFFK
ncbi:MAG: PBP1A family penicillin-binding protein [Streptococcaceae bacterium]|jgi:penicillin-binding protein 2A|nr:PBP1A family penicillin-binding protein [Streptococcaceae bacterium]